MVRASDVNVDDIWRALGPWGKYQLKQAIFSILMCVSWAIHQLTIVFIGFRPTFQCNKLNESSFDDTNNIWRKYGQCSIKTYDNSSGDVTEISKTNCVNGWEYDIPTEQSFVTEWDYVCENAELAELSQTLLVLGMMIGLFIFPTMSDRFGRKPTMVIGHVSLFVIVLATAFSPNYYVFITLRILTGAVSVSAMAGNTLSIESFPTEIRCYQEVMTMLTWTTAICVMSPIAYAFRNIPWQYLQITYALMSSWSFFQWWILDESLRWVIVNGKLDRAKQIIKNACKWNKKSYNKVIKQTGLQELLSDDREMKEKTVTGLLNEDKAPKVVVKRGSLIDIVRHTHIRKVTIIMSFLWITDSLTYYGLYMISSNLYGDRYVNFLLSALLEYPAIFFEFIALNRLGRKWTSLICHLVAATGLLCATGLRYSAGCYVIDDVVVVANDVVAMCGFFPSRIRSINKGDNSSLLTAGTAFTLLGKMAISGALSSTFILTSELFPTNMRNSGLGVASCIGKVGAMISPFFRNVGETVPWLPGCVFSIMCLIAVCMLAFVPETNGVDLPQTVDELTEWYSVSKFSLSIGKNKKAKKKTNTDRLADSEDQILQ